MNIICDTNIIYHLSGVSVNEHVNNVALEKILKSNQCFASSLSVIEIINRYNKDFDKLKKALNPIFNNTLKPKIYIRDNIITATEINRLFYSDSIDLNSDIINKAVKEKIEMESEVFRFFLYLIVLATMWILEKENIEVYAIYLEYLSHTKDMTFGSIKKEFELGYKYGKIQKRVKNKFNEMYRDEIWYLALFKYLAQYYKQNESSAKKFHVFLEEKISSDKLLDEIIKLENPIAFVKEQSIEESVGVLKEILDSKITNKVYVKYIIFKMEKLLYEKAAFRKNDIIDMMILGTIFHGEDDVRILTIDKANYRFLKQINDPSTSLIKQVFPRFEEA